MGTELLHGEPVAAEIRASVRQRVSSLQEAEVAPTLGTVLVSADTAANRFMDLKHDACRDVGIDTRDHRLDPEAPESRVLKVVESLGADSGVDGIFVQAPLPDHVRELRVRRAVDPAKDVDCFHPTNLGRLVAGSPRFRPATPSAVRALLDAYDIPVEGRDVVVVGRSGVIGKPLANMLLEDGPGGNATVTVCHSRTTDLGEKTRQADVLVTAAGVPELVDASMVSNGVVVVDVSANRTESGDTVGDVAFDAVREKASAITPVPGGVGPVTLAALLENVTLAAEQRADDERRTNDGRRADERDSVASDGDR